MKARHIVIVGGGFSGASAAVQLARKLPEPVAITLIEPRETVGPGLAYSTEDPGFRLNAPAGAHSIDVADPAHFIRWCDAQDLRERDPGAYAPNGQPFARRRDFGRYLAETVRDHARMPNGTTIGHCRARVNDISIEGRHAMLSLNDGAALTADQIILATGNPAPRCPAMLAGDLAGHPAIRANPLVDGIEGIAPDARVLVIGAGLTALDMVAGLISRGHQGPITVISRRGLRPRPQPPAVLTLPPDPPGPPIIPLDLLNAPLPPYAQAEPLTALGLLRGLRAHIREVEADGQSWHAAFDAVAFPLSRIWPRLSPGEQQRALKRLRPFYDAYRFRTPPMTEARVRAAEQSGQVRYGVADIQAVSPAADGSLSVRSRAGDGTGVTQHFDVIVNCSGLDSGGTTERNLLLAGMVTKGLLTPHPTGLGFVTDLECRAIAVNGSAMPRLRIIGPPSAGMFGDPLGAFFISAQIHRIIPALADDLFPTDRSGAAA